MSAILFTCPATGQNVHLWVADSPAEFDHFEAVECTACRRVHLVNPKSGKVAGEGKTTPSRTI